ncbi:MAG TPA: 3-phosphoshikimate 1-carboxyvinyltransferase, partial [Thermoleophilia bacterium]|nr:3-phosphoshikimate 1-carboxyvinyltransferase [Thermoleophilia bacterium]
TGFGRSGDTLATVDGVRALGVEIEWLGEDELVVHGAGLRGLRAPDDPLDAGNSGTGMRLLSGLLAGQDGAFVLDGDRSLRARPMDRIVEPLRAMGATIAAREDRFPPLSIVGGPLTAITYRPPVASAQVKSCVLLAGLLAEGETVVVEPVASRDHTERMLAAAGAALDRRGDEVAVRGARHLGLDRVVVPGDASSAAFLVAAALLVPGSHLRITDVGLNPSRLGFYEVVRRMGATVDWTVTDEDGGEPRGELEVKASALHGTTVPATETPSLIDEVTLLALLGCFAEGETVVAGVADLRHKESDRLAAVVAVIESLGGVAEADRDELRIVPSALRGGAVSSLGDHRLAMLGAVAGLVCPQGVTVRGFSAAAVTFPDFTSTLAEVLSS